MISQILPHVPSMVRDITSSLKREVTSLTPVLQVSSDGFLQKEYNSGEQGLAKKKQTKCRSKRPEGAQTYTKSLKTTSPIKVTIKVI